jgi:lantibiotic modifying enzyme
MNEHNRFVTAAQSVADSLAAMAEPAVGGTRWETLNYAGDRQYSTAVFGGMAGIIFLFSDLFRVTRDTRAREVAEAAAMWVDRESKAALTESEANPSLYSGLAGDGQMFLHLFEATGRDRWLRCAMARVRALGRAVYPDTHMLSGSSGSLVFLLRAYHATNDEAVLTIARGLGDDIVRCATRDASGVRWAWERPAGSTTPHGTFFGTGFGHGASGVAYALAELWSVTGDDALADAVTGTVAWIESVAINTSYGVGWGRWPDDPHDPRVQWCHGPPGIGLFAVRAAEIFANDEFLDLALRCGRATQVAGDIRQNPSQCHGLSGNGELLLELARVTGDDSWFGHAADFGDAAMVYQHEVNNSVRWLGDEPGNYSPDFMLGAAGLGHYFLRLARPTDVHMPLMVVPRGERKDS